MRPGLAGYVAGAFLALAASGCASLPKTVRDFNNLAGTYSSARRSPCPTQYGILESVIPIDDVDKFELHLDKELVSVGVVQQNDHVDFSGERTPIASDLTFRRDAYFNEERSSGQRISYVYRGQPFEGDIVGVFRYPLPRESEERWGEEATKKDRKDFRNGIKTFSKAIGECLKGEQK